MAAINGSDFTSPGRLRDAVASLGSGDDMVAAATPTPQVLGVPGQLYGKNPTAEEIIGLTQTYTNQIANPDLLAYAQTTNKPVVMLPIPYTGPTYPDYYYGAVGTPAPPVAPIPPQVTPMPQQFQYTTPQYSMFGGVVIAPAAVQNACAPAQQAPVMSAPTCGPVVSAFQPILSQLHSICDRLLGMYFAAQNHPVMGFFAGVFAFMPQQQQTNHQYNPMLGTQQHPSNRIISQRYIR